MSKNEPRCNGEIKSSQIRLIDIDGNMLGVVSLQDGLQRASGHGMDLVEISPNVNPPVCKVMDYGKYKYEMQKKAQAARKNQKTVDIKEITVRPTIAEGDYQVKMKKARTFLDEGTKVRFSLVFKGREITHNEVGFAIINRIKEELGEDIKIDVEPKLEGKQIFMIVSSK